MSDRRVSLLECIEQAASSASRDARAQENAVEKDEMDDDRLETVGAAIEGAATNTTDQARQDAAPVSIYPTHDATAPPGRGGARTEDTRPRAPDAKTHVGPKTRRPPSAAPRGPRS